VDCVRGRSGLFSDISPRSDGQEPYGPRNDADGHEDPELIFSYPTFLQGEVTLTISPTGSTFLTAMLTNCGTRFRDLPSLHPRAAKARVHRVHLRRRRRLRLESPTRSGCRCRTKIANRGADRRWLLAQGHRHHSPTACFRRRRRHTD
jgi:hypothetical protein